MSFSHSIGLELATPEGFLRSAGGMGIVHIETSLRQSVQDIWSAFSQPNQLVSWLGEFNGKFHAGETFSARFSASEWEGTGCVENCQPKRRMLVKLLEKGSANPHSVEIKIKRKATHRILIVEERGIPINLLPAYGAGLQVHVEHLLAHLSGDMRCDAKSRWNEIFPAYKAKSIEIKAI